MDYPLENLSPEKFQLFCQALLAREFRNLQCMPVAQPDGGRDAIQWRTTGTKAEFVVFQIKFVRQPQAEAEPHKWIEAIVAEEAQKVKRLIPVGAKQYVLLTNVPGTAHLDAGAIDTVNAFLSKELGIPSVCWWRNDLCRRLDDAWNLKWVYPELMTGPDLIRLVIESGLSDNKERRASAIRAFVAHQYAFEQEVKFKQVELQNRLLDLFIDVPIQIGWGERYYPDPEMARYWETADYGYATQEPDFEEDTASYYQSHRDRPAGAASFLLSDNIQRRRLCVVLQGAPGQGKSTITQYVCQVHRMRLLQKNNDLGQIPGEHQSSPVRLPVKVDLRDFATWLERKNPFNAEGETLKDATWAKTLESFLAALVRHGSGGAQFDVSDLQAVFRLCAVLLVLDGLDEVADIRRRKEVVEEIEKGVSRLESNAASLQVIVTSRPTAFANSPGLSEKKFEYFSLSSVSRELIDEYADKWLKARRMEERESAEVKKILKIKLDQPHIRDLARNPMQLAILLSLIHTRGHSLPDKRTALYDAYIDLFFSREAEKSGVVREYRDLLIDIHRYLAWILHTESEAESGGPGVRKHGALSAERLIQVLRAYLEVEGRDPGLAEMLFTGVAERVMALVSRVQGTFEFEVQPLREYFAARFLFETAPYSPTGGEKRGTRPDRFDAICRNFYWLNVTRFYAGCYSKGELASLIDRLNELAKDKDFRLLSHPRILAATLLGDWVFSQHPKSVREAIKLILDDLGLRFVLTSNSRRLSHTEPLVLPKDCGKSELTERCFALLGGIPPVDFALDTIDLLKANCSPEELLPIWKKRIADRKGEDRRAWLLYGLHLGCFSGLTNEELIVLVSDQLSDAQTLDILIRGRRIEFLEATTDRFDLALNAIMEKRVQPSPSWRYQKLLDLVGYSVDGSRFAAAFSAPMNAPLMAVWKRHARKSFSELSVPNYGMIESENVSKCRQIVEILANESKKDANLWARTLGPWESLVETIRKAFGDCWAVFNLSNVAAGIKSTTETCTDAGVLFDSFSSLCRRARYARLRAGAPQWWSQQLKQASDETAKCWLTLLWFTWASQATMRQNAEEINAVLTDLPEFWWGRLFDSVEEGINLTASQSGDRLMDMELSSFPEDLSPRMYALLQFRAKRTAAHRLYANKLQSYKGDDLRILKVLQSCAVKSLMYDRSENWNPNITVIERAFLKGVISEPYINYDFVRSPASRSMPFVAASHIAENASRYPAFLVAAAEARCRAEFEKKVRPVAKVAESEGWFQH